MAGQDTIRGLKCRKKCWACKRSWWWKMPSHNLSLVMCASTLPEPWSRPVTSGWSGTWAGLERGHPLGSLGNGRTHRFWRAGSWMQCCSYIFFPVMKLPELLYCSFSSVPSPPPPLSFWVCSFHVYKNFFCHICRLTSTLALSLSQVAGTTQLWQLRPPLCGFFPFPWIPTSATSSCWRAACNWATSQKTSSTDLSQKDYPLSFRTWCILSEQHSSPCWRRSDISGE